jgi:hypothetical protein
VRGAIAFAVRGSSHNSPQASGVEVVGGYVTDGTGPYRVQQVIGIDRVGDQDHRRFGCGAADPAGRSDSVADDAASDQADLWLLALGCSYCLLGVLGLGANVSFSAQRHPHPKPCRLVIREQQRDTTRC